MQCQTDFILLQCSLEDFDASTLAQAAVKFCTQSPMPMSLHRLAWSATARIVYLYARLDQPGSVDESLRPALVAIWARLCEGARDTQVSRLEKVFAIDGHDCLATPACHYVVEMDPDAGWMPEIARWYDTEHLPGLAAVPGCVRAMRLLNHDHGPLSLACYDLVTSQTLGSPPWLAVRASAWSDITRPHFTHTKRTMFQMIATV